ncbi:hypothetical protein GH714_043701 [Hevea brasiliensis]|uniref:Serine aminopeptidase S33 domain-containing protein n=1 Tax=Hevea brasiliensis TaxID=3981 RepID=A0A6A6K1J6_HEVBR|nr:hypothetical protein GH714_043701 [Hevea brasiliensis]
MGRPVRFPGISNELQKILVANMDEAPARRRAREAFKDIQLGIDHILFKSPADGLKIKESYEVNSRGLEIFTKSWLPETSPPRAVLCYCHGYGDTCTFFFEGIARKLASSGYGVFAMDYPGFGLSEGLHCYIPSFDRLVDDVIEHFSKVKEDPAIRTLPSFLFGQSMGGAVALKVHLKQPDAWNGAILVAPMCKTAYNVIAYKDKPRLKTALEMLRTTEEIEERLGEVSLPLLILHGESDIVTDPSVSKALYEKARSSDKKLKLYKDAFHSLLEGVARKLASSGYGVFAMDYPGFGLSEGLHGYIPSLDKLVNDVAEHYSKIKENPKFQCLPSYLFGQSLGGAIAMKVHLKQPDAWNGAILVAPMCKFADNMIPPWIVVQILIGIAYLFPKLKIVPHKNFVKMAFRDLKKQELAAYNVIAYKDTARLWTALECLRTTQELEQRLQEVSVPLLILHGEADVVTDPSVSKALYEKASSSDKKLKLYKNAFHSLLEGEPDDTIFQVLDDIICWLEDHSVKKIK